MIKSLLGCVRATEAISDLFGSENAELRFRVQYHDWDTSHRASQTTLLVESVDPALIMQDMVSNSISHAADQINATVGEEFQGSIAGLNCKDL